MNGETMTTITTQSPVEIDTELARIYGERQANRARRAQISDHIAYGARNHAKLHYRVEASPEQIAEFVAFVEGNEPNDYRTSSYSRLLVEKAALKAADKELAEQQRPLDAEFNARRWSRFFLVTSSNGLIHSSMDCSTCNNGKSWTEFGWLPSLSGSSEEEAVASQGALLCTVCFPSAPVHWTNGRELEAAAKAATQCQGKRDYDAPSRTGYYTGNWATCSACGDRVTLTSAGNLRKHKAKA